MLHVNSLCSVTPFISVNLWSVQNTLKLSEPVKREMKQRWCLKLWTPFVTCRWCLIQSFILWITASGRITQAPKSLYHLPITNFFLCNNLENEMDVQKSFYLFFYFFGSKSHSILWWIWTREWWKQSYQNVLWSRFFQIKFCAQNITFSQFRDKLWSWDWSICIYTSNISTRELIWALSRIWFIWANTAYVTERHHS